MICVDASVAAKWILQEEDWAMQAGTLLGATLPAGEPIVAPPLLPFAITTILRRRLKAATPVSLERVLYLLEEFSRLPIELRNPPGMHRRALILASEYGVPATYDAHYLALAERLDCVLWTDDRGLLRLVGDRLPFVRAIGDYQMPA